MKADTKALIWPTKKKIKPKKTTESYCFSAYNNLKKVQQEKKQNHLPIIYNLTV